MTKIAAPRNRDFKSTSKWALSSWILLPPRKLKARNPGTRRTKAHAAKRNPTIMAFPAQRSLGHDALWMTSAERLLYVLHLPALDHLTSISSPQNTSRDKQTREDPSMTCPHGKWHPRRSMTGLSFQRDSDVTNRWRTAGW